MATFRDLPKDLIETAAKLLAKFRSEETLSENNINEVSPPNPKIEKWIKANKERFMKEYGAEKGKEVLYAKAWKMHKEGVEINEDDIPGQADSAFDNQRDKKEKETAKLSEGDDGGVSEDQPVGDNELLYKKAKVDAESGLPELGEDDCGCGDKHKKDRIKGPHGAMRMTPPVEQPMMAENYASPEPCSAVGHREGPETPKSASVLVDMDMRDGKHVETYRMFIIYPNKWPVIIPGPEVPGAASIEALRALTAGVLDPSDIIGEAIQTVLDLPVKDPHFSGDK